MTDSMGDPITALSGTPANVESDPNQGTDSLAQQEAYAMAQYGNNQGILNYIAQNYGDIMWMMNDPELKQVIISTVVNGWSQAKVDAALGSTNWWKQNGSSVRTFYQTQQQDPATAAQEVAQNKAIIQEAAQTIGVNLNDQQLTNLATQASMFSWNSQQIDQNIRSAYQTPPPGGQQTGDAASIEGVIQSVAGQYMTTASQSDINYWTNVAVKGNQTAAQVQTEYTNYLQGLVSQRYPWMKTALSQGMTPQQYLAPYATQAEQTLSLSPGAINWSDPKWQAALLTTDSSGQQVPVNTDQFNKNLMQNPVFGYSKTQGAINQAYAVSQQIEQTFGKVAS